MGDLRHVETWIFDLDNTLYPSDSGLFRQIDAKMTAFIAERLALSAEDARALQKRYYRDYGTTLNGLMKRHGVPPKDFLEYVHDIDLAGLEPAPELSAQISELPGRRYVMTNGSAAHAENILAKLGIDAHFDGVFDIAAADYRPKPHRPAYDAFIERFEFDAARAAMFEDLPQNLEAPHALGMTTILLRTEMVWGPDEAPAQDTPDHVHYAIDDLAAFLSAARFERARRSDD